MSGEPIREPLRLSPFRTCPADYPNRKPDAARARRTLAARSPRHERRTYPADRAANPCACHRPAHLSGEIGRGAPVRQTVRHGCTCHRPAKRGGRRANGCRTWRAVACPFRLRRVDRAQIAADCPRTCHRSEPIREPLPRLRRDYPAKRPNRKPSGEIATDGAQERHRRGGRSDGKPERGRRRTVATVAEPVPVPNLSGEIVTGAAQERHRRRGEIGTGANLSGARERKGGRLWRVSGEPIRHGRRTLAARSPRHERQTVRTCPRSEPSGETIRRGTVADCPANLSGEIGPARSQQERQAGTWERLRRADREQIATA